MSRPTSLLPHLGAVDGLRAVAVVAVLLYHFDVDVLGGGFLGVEVFFVISGFLITGLLAGEYDRDGTVRLRSFWWRRVRRLVPALWFSLAGTVLAVRLLAPGELSRLRGEVLAALGYVSNWFLIERGVSYFDSFARPSPLRHLWSLAIEEQYYLLWPPLMLVAVRVLPRRGVLVALGAVAAASTAWMALRFEPGADPSRVYFGLDTRLGGLAIGSMLGLWWHAAPGDRSERPPLPALRWAGAAAGAGLVVTFVVAGETAQWLYRGGFLGVAVLTATVIAATASGDGPLARALATPVAQWVGRRSYALYLVHWPITVFTRPGADLDVSWGTALVLRVALTLVAAEVCHRAVEVPLRAIRSGDVPRSARVERLGRSTLAGAAVVLLLVMVLPVPASTDVRDVLADLPEELVVEAPTDPAAVPTLPPTSAPAPTTPDPTAVPPLPAPEAVRLTGPPVLAVGDSVMLRSAQALAGFLSPFSRVDAKVSRQFGEGPGIISLFRGSGYPFSAVVVHLGTNGPPTAAQVDRIVAAAGPVPVLLVNLRVFRAYQEAANQTLAEAAARHPNVRIVDWYALSAGHPEWFESDLVHTNNAGVGAYVGLITSALLSVQLDPVLGPTMTMPPTTLPPPTLPTLPPTTTTPPPPPETTPPPTAPPETTPPETAPPPGP